jgi:hypothetical protein
MALHILAVGGAEMTGAGVFFAVRCVDRPHRTAGDVSAVTGGGRLTDRWSFVQLCGSLLTSTSCWEG